MVDYETGTRIDNNAMVKVDVDVAKNMFLCDANVWKLGKIIGAKGGEHMLCW